MLDTVIDAARREGLAVLGAFHPVAEDLPPAGVRTLVLLGPGGPEMWEAFAAGPERRDGQPHPMDRWSKRVIGALADRLEATACFPFGGPPWQPFQRWATRIGAVVSPVAMQATRSHGLWTSFRGALGFRDRMGLGAPAGGDPCRDCAAPCRTACPVDAFRDGFYDTEACLAHVTSPAGTACRSGCLVRRSCPAGAHLNLPEEQRAFHMDAFLAAHAT